MTFRAHLSTGSLACACDRQFDQNLSIMSLPFGTYATDAYPVCYSEPLTLRACLQQMHEEARDRLRALRSCEQTISDLMEQMQRKDATIAKLQSDNVRGAEMMIKMQRDHQISRASNGQPARRDTARPASQVRSCLYIIPSVDPQLRCESIVRA